MGKKKRNKAQTLADAEAARDELIALKGIFGEEYNAHDDGHGFSLVVVPHPAEAAANFTSVELDIRYPHGYPAAELEVKAHDAKGLSAEEAKSLLKALQKITAQFSEAGEVCVFNVVDACQEFLQQHNAAPQMQQTKPSSLWHEMEQRNKMAAVAETFAVGESAESLAKTGQGWGDFGFGELFQEEEAAWPAIQRHQPFKSESARDVSRFVKRLNLDRHELDPPPLRKHSSATVFSSQAERTASSGSMVGSVLSKVRSAVRGVLGMWPPAVRQLLEKPSGGSEAGDTSSEPGELSAEQAALQKDMLLGHLLRLSMSTSYGGAALPAHALASVTADLVAAGLMPRWLQWAVTQQPALFDRAVSRMFARNLRGEAAGEAHDSAALQAFWHPKLQADPQSQPPHSESLSRYQADFQELRVLGRGAYGLAVAAVNRLDGRQYAVKKIRLQQQVPDEFSRILREVSTLARLQHTNIVRYFQAWTEMAGSNEAIGLEGESELREWQRESTSSLRASKGRRKRNLGALQPPRVAGLSSETEGESGGAFTEEESSRGLWQSSEASESSGSGSEDEPVDLRDQVQMLYIQMEFCPRTLKEVLEHGPIEDEDAWQILRQILAGLAHIHAQGIIHRDLKPENIFFDSQGVLKLGDFGLAKFLRPANEQASPAQLPSDDEAEMPPVAKPAAKLMSGPAPEVTGRVGTSFYMSPEVAHGWARYDAKVDLYSLGVVALELWHPFSTGMERVDILRKFTSEDCTLPCEWEARHPQVAKLIRWLTERNPFDRPSAKEALRSNMLPTNVGDEQVSDLLRSLPTHAETLDRVLDTLFHLPSNWDLLDASEVPGNPATGQITEREELLRILKTVFGRHGAVPMSSSLLGFQGQETPPNAAVFLDRSGARIVLRHEMRSPFAAWLARQADSIAGSGASLETMRRYEIAWVRRNAPGRALPRAYLQADLDFLSSGNKNTTEAALLEAEIVKTAVEVLEALPETPAFEVRLGHRLLLDALLEYIGLSQEVMKSAMEMLATTAAISPQHLSERTKHWPSVQIALSGLRVGPDAVSRCKQFILQIPGKAESSLSRLRAKLESPGSGGREVAASAWAAIDSLEAIVAHLHAWDLKPDQVVVDPLLWPHTDYLTGPLAQVHLLASDGSGSSSMVAAGGRYDGLLKQLWAAKTEGPPPAAVGLTLNVKLLLPFMAAARHHSQFPVSQVDVLVGSRGGGMLKERMALAKELWAAGIKAHFLQAGSPSLTAFYDFARHHHVAWLATIERSSFSAATTVKVKNLERRSAEEEMPFADVAKYLAQHAFHSTNRPDFERSKSTAQPLDGSGGYDDSRGQDEDKFELKILNKKPRRRDRRG